MGFGNKVTVRLGSRTFTYPHTVLQKGPQAARHLNQALPTYSADRSRHLVQLISHSLAVAVTPPSPVATVLALPSGRAGQPLLSPAFFTPIEYVPAYRALYETEHTDTDALAGVVDHIFIMLARPSSEDRTASPFDRCAALMALSALPLRITHLDAIDDKLFEVLLPLIKFDPEGTASELLDLIGTLHVLAMHGGKTWGHYKDGFRSALRNVEDALMIESDTHRLLLGLTHEALGELC